MKRNSLLLIAALLAFQTTFSQNKKVLDSLKAKIENLQSDNLTIRLISEQTIIKQFDWEKNMPWIAAIIISIITVLLNLYISRQSRKTTMETVNTQMENSRKIVQLDFNKTVLSGNRQVWINALRDAISDYIAKCNSYGIKLEQIKSKGKEAAQTADNTNLTEILQLEIKIVLMLNSNEEDAQRLIKLLGQFTTALFDDTIITQPSEVFQQQIIDITKTILKKEWERVKRGE